MKFNKILICDLEATCWETKEESTKHTSEIIEIGIVVLNLETGEVEKSEGILVKPTISVVSPFCTKLTTITQELLDKEGISFKDAYFKLTEEYDSYDTPWASYGEYDKNMLIKQSNRYDWDTPMSNSHTNVKTLFSNKINGGKPVGMASALRTLKIPLEGTHHRGVDDARNIAKIFLKLNGK